MKVPPRNARGTLGGSAFDVSAYWSQPAVKSPPSPTEQKLSSPTAFNKQAQVTGAVHASGRGPHEYA